MPSQGFSITYAGVKVGGDSSVYKIDGPFRYTEAYPTATIEAEVDVVQSPAYTEAQFNTACAALEAAYRKPWQSLTIVLGSTTMKTLSHSSNTGMNAQPSIRKTGSVEDTGRSRRYTISVVFELPADLTGQSFRRSSMVEVNYDSSRVRTLTITGEYTAGGSDSARTKYTTNSPTYFASVISALTGTFEIIDETATTDDQDKTCQFRIAYREIVYNQSAAGVDHTNVVRHNVTFSRQSPAPGDSGGGKVQRLATIICAYTANVRGTQDLVTLWRDTLRPYVITEFKRLFVPNNGAVVELELPVFDQTNQTIVCSLQFKAALAGTSGIVESEIVQQYKEVSGVYFTGRWDGDPLSLFTDQGFNTVLRIFRRRIVVWGTVGPTRRLGVNAGSGFFGAFFGPLTEGGGSGSGPPASGPLGGLNAGGGSGGQTWILIDNDSSTSVRYVGLPGGDQMPLTEVVESTVERLVKTPR